MSVITHYKGSISMKNLAEWVNLPRSSYYYKPSHNRKGIPPSTTTIKRDGTEVSNNEVVDEIKKIVSGEFVCYGYHNVTSELKDKKFIINHKKAYRLMDENQLLLGKVIKTHGKREFVQFRKITATRPSEGCDLCCIPKTVSFCHNITRATRTPVYLKQKIIHLS